MTNVKKMEPLIDDRINHWISRIDDLFAKTHQKMDFAPWAVYVAYDIISEVGFGESIFSSFPSPSFLLGAMGRKPLGWTLTGFTWHGETVCIQHRRDSVY